MSTYSVCFYNGKFPSAYTAVYTVPNGQTVVIRDIEIWNSALTSELVDVEAIQTPGGPNAVIYLVSVPSNGWVQWEGRAVIGQGGTLNLSGTGESTVYIMVSGYLLSGFTPI